MSLRPDPASFRDPDGFVFEQHGEYYRAISKKYALTWEKLMASGFLDELMREGKVLRLDGGQHPFGELDKQRIHKVYKIQPLPVITYPPEWSFAQFKKAALLSLTLQRKAVSEGFSLKDASAYNLQFIGREVVFIDHLSFEELQVQHPWKAYAQFCRHFLAPLLLWHYGIPEPQLQFLNHLDGIPLQHCTQLLPWKSRFSLLAYTHIHLHSRFENKHAGDKELDYKGKSYSLKKHLNLLEHLEMGIKELTLADKQSNWSRYYDNFSYSNQALQKKLEFVKKYSQRINGKLCLDLGANTGIFSFLAAEHFQQVLACDLDEQVLREIRKKKKDNVLTLRVDLSNPLPSYGWNSSERRSFLQRVSHNELTLALALVHHLCISNNIPLTKLAEFFAGISQNLIIEFVPKNDVQAKRLLVSREDIFEHYTKSEFEKSFSQHYDIEEEQYVPDSDRVLYFMKRKSNYAKA